MNKINYLIIVACFAFMLSSCSSSFYYQICDVYSTNTPRQGDKYVYEDDNCKVTYDFWAENGDAGFVFTNKTDKNICVNLEKTFFVNNGVSNNYYFSIPKERIYIPAKSNKKIEEYPILTSPYRNCDLLRVVNGNRIPIHDGFGNVIRYEYVETMVTKEFDKETSPIVFSNIICYSIENSNEEIVVTNEFFIQKIANKTDTEELKKAQVGCENEKYKVEFFVDQAPNRFYIPYNTITDKKKH